VTTATPDRGAMVRLSALPRVLISGAAGCVAGVIVAWFVPWFVPWQISVLVGWIVAAGVFSAWILIGVARLDAVDTEHVAVREDDSRSAAEIVLILASLFSLLGVGTALFGASEKNAVWTATIALVSVTVAWLAVQLVYTLRYAHIYYSDGGGIDFNQQEKPDYRDFAYVAFTLGMTYQVSDTNVSSKRIRRTMTKHGILSYVFGVGVVATMVNVVVSLARG
jgi:uncharacterized membrane protein